MSLRSLTCLRIRFSCVPCNFFFFSNTVLETREGARTTTAFAVFRSPEEAQALIDEINNVKIDDLGPSYLQAYSNLRSLEEYASVSFGNIFASCVS